MLLDLPHVVETMQWGDKLVFWVGDKAIGGKMFAVISLDSAEGSGGRLVAFAAGPERFAELCEREDVVPAPYLARSFWVAAMRWDALGAAEWRELLASAHALTLLKLPAKTRAVLALPPAEQRRAVQERRRVLANRAKVADASTKAGHSRADGASATTGEAKPRKTPKARG